ncbi:MAG: LysR family transcriptional regulator [Acidimicrobiia bacterium]|nr:LysR family transcriptional regulator [Acidimicrobiia bacterium]
MPPVGRNGRRHLTDDHPTARPGAAAIPVNVNTRTLAYLQKVAELSSFTEAAEEFGISQPALSQSLAQLEQRLGIVLFEQDGRRRRLTEAGRTVAEFAGEVLGRTSELETWIQSHHDGDVGQLRIGLTDAATLYLLPDALMIFRETHPGVELQLIVDSTTALCDLLARYELDLVFAVGPPPPGLVGEMIGAEELRVYARRNDEGDQTGAAEHGWALPPARSRTRALIDASLAERGIEPVVTLTSQNPDVLRQVAAVGLALTVLPAAVGGNDPSLRDVLGEAVALRPLTMMRRESAPDDARVAALGRLARDMVRLTGAATPAP